MPRLGLIVLLSAGLWMIGCTTRGHAYHTTTCLLPTGGFISVIFYGRLETDEGHLRQQILQQCEAAAGVPHITSSRSQD